MRSLWSEQRPDFGPGRIGLMADSHGDRAAIAAAVSGLRASGCNLLIHLGDICDSADATTAAACVAQLTGPAILAVRGNNDHALINDASAELDSKTRIWLEGLPLSIEIPSALFTHNRPGIARLGVAALVGDLDDSEAERFLRSFPGRLLFRGHSHHPLLRRLGPRGLERLVPATGRGSTVAGGAVITCGSLEKATALVWNTETGRVYRLCL